MIKSYPPSKCYKRSENNLKKKIKLKPKQTNYFHASPFQLLVHICACSKHILRLLQERDTVYLDCLWLSREFLLTWLDLRLSCWALTHF